MAKSVHNDVIDDGLNVIKNNANLMIACSAEPTTRTEAVTTYALADIAMVAGDFTIADGDVNGRKLTVAAKSGALVDASGDATHIALVDATRLLFVTTCTPQTLTAGNTVNYPAWDVEISDPT
ncbi:MAG TPA: hypothetical protein EYH05_10780 [Anaerolineae bacterium]|nr:hypothetical protein [Anaerolineae bacterium]